MNRHDDKTKAQFGLMILTVCVVASMIVFTASTAHAQCTTLSSRDCRTETGFPRDYSFSQTKLYWSVVGVVPTTPDDKDMYVYTECNSGTGLAGSTGTNGTDFIVCDFNHTPLGTFYPQIIYGDALASYDVYWNDGGERLPIGTPLTGTLGGSGAGCNMMKVFDVYLELGAEYRFSFDPAVGLSGNVALFQNPGTDDFWAGRFASEFEITATQSKTYLAPVSDWYGLVVFPTWSLSTPEFFSLTIEKINDCQPLARAVCESHKLYDHSAGPKNDFSFTQTTGDWSVIALTPDTLDTKTLEVYTGCDQSGVGLAKSDLAGTGATELIVGDFNHNALADYNARVSNGQLDRAYTIEWNTGPEIIDIPSEIVGTMYGQENGCDLVQIWDVYLEAGKEYEFYFGAWGQKDPHLALFRNPGTGGYWAGRQDAEFVVSGAGEHPYTAPQSDWYGLVVFANSRKEHTSSFVLRVEELNDCVPLTSGLCETAVGWPRDFSYYNPGGFWSVVSLTASEGDTKAMSVTPQCDGKGSLLGFTSSSSTDLDFVVGDFNHNTPGTYYASITNNDHSALYTVESDTGTDPAQDLFPFDTIVSGSIPGAGGDCGMIKIWDVYLEASQTYHIGFTNTGSADVRLALFRNSGNGSYWGTRSDAVREFSESDNYTYTAPASDWYGLVVFPGNTGGVGTYTIRISEWGATGIDAEPLDPERFALRQNAPNPFNPTTTIGFDVPPSGGHVSINIYDVSGRLVRTLVNGAQSPGEKSVIWDGKDDHGTQASTGVYFYRITAAGFAKTRKMVLMK